MTASALSDACSCASCRARVCLRDAELRAWARRRASPLHAGGAGGRGRRRRAAPERGGRAGRHVLGARVRPLPPGRLPGPGRPRLPRAVPHVPRCRKPYPCLRSLSRRPLLRPWAAAGEERRARAGLLSCATTDWFEDWPAPALRQVAAQALADAELGTTAARDAICQARRASRRVVPGLAHAQQPGLLRDKTCDVRAPWRSAWQSAAWPAGVCGRARRGGGGRRPPAPAGGGPQRRRARCLPGDGPRLQARLPLTLAVPFSRPGAA